MAKIPSLTDPTLDAADRALETRENGRPPRPYLGMSGLGRECRRQIWYEFRWSASVWFDAAALKRFADGHRVEDVQAERLRMVPGLTLWTVRPEDGRQFGCEDLGGHLKGHVDGVVLGLIQAPKTPHVWEHKSVAPKKFEALKKLVDQVGEKNALREWDVVYHAQAQLYMHYFDLDRHYLTCTTPGGREATSVRTERDVTEAIRLIEKARAIVFADHPPARISEDASFYQCRWCAFAGLCHGADKAERNCRTCLHSTPLPEGGWHCAALDRMLSITEQRAGCGRHLYLPGLVAGEQTDAGDGWVSYVMPSGETWTDGGAT